MSEGRCARLDPERLGHLLPPPGPMRAQRLRRLVDTYTGNARALLERLRRALAADDAAAAAHCAHDLRTMAATVGALTLTTRLQDLAAALKTGRKPCELLVESWPEVEDEQAAVCRAVALLPESP